LSELKVGSRVITKSGLHGKIVEIKDGSESCVIETMAGKIRYEISAISLEMSSKLVKKK
jgi:preprotein translocase subunit YajC